MTIVDTSCKPHPTLELPPGLAVFTRPHEVCLDFKPSVHPKSGMPIICPVHGPLGSGRFCWDHRITADSHRPAVHKIGEDWFRCARPLSGDEPCGGSWSHVFRGELGPNGVTRDGLHLGERLYRPGSSCYGVPMCGDCGRYATVRVWQEAYGDRTRCRACGAEHWYSIGD